MRRKPILLRCVVAITMGCVLAPANHTFATQPSRASSNEAKSVRDVALGEGGVFSGQFIDPAGALLPGVPLALLRNGVEVGTFSTDRQGMFAISGLTGGSYELVTGSTRQHYRLWAPGTAPPASRNSALVRSDGSIARGQSPTSAGGGMSGGALFALGTVGLITGGVIAILSTDSGS